MISTHHHSSHNRLKEPASLPPRSQKENETTTQTTTTLNVKKLQMTIGTTILNNSFPRTVLYLFIVYCTILTKIFLHFSRPTFRKSPSEARERASFSKFTKLRLKGKGCKCACHWIDWISVFPGCQASLALNATSDSLIPDYLLRSDNNLRNC